MRIFSLVKISFVALAAIAFVFSVDARADGCDPIFGGETKSGLERRLRETLSYLAQLKSSGDFMVAWSSKRPFNYEQFLALRKAAEVEGLEVVTQLEKQDLPRGIEFLNAFIFHGSSDSVGRLLRRMAELDVKLAQFDALNQPRAQISTRFFLIQIESALARRTELQSLLENRDEKIFLVSDVASFSLVSIVDGPTYRELMGESKLTGDAIPLSQIVERWSDAVHLTSKTHVRISLGDREFVMLDQNGVGLLQAKIVNRNKETEAIANVASALRTPPRTVEKPVRLSLVKPIGEPVRVEPANSAVVAKPQPPLPAVSTIAPKTAGAYTLVDFVSKDLPLLHKHPSLGGMQFALLTQSSVPKFYILNAAWARGTDVDKVVSTLQNAHPANPVLSAGSVRSLEVLSSGDSLSDPALKTRSLAELRGTHGAAILKSEHENGRTVIVTTESDGNARIVGVRYVLVPIGSPKPSAVPPVAVPVTAPVPQSAPVPATVRVSKAQPARSALPPVTITDFIGNRRIVMGDASPAPLSLKHPVRLLVRSGAPYFLIFNAQFLEKSTPYSLETLIRDQYPQLLNVLSAHGKFFNAVRNGTDKHDRYVSYTLSDVVAAGYGPRLQSAFDRQLPIVVEGNRVRSDQPIEFVMVPVPRTDREQVNEIPPAPPLAVKVDNAPVKISEPVSEPAKDSEPVKNVQAEAEPLPPFSITQLKADLHVFATAFNSSPRDYVKHAALVERLERTLRNAQAMEFAIAEIGTVVTTTNIQKWNKRADNLSLKYKTPAFFGIRQILRLFDRSLASEATPDLAPSTIKDSAQKSALIAAPTAGERTATEGLEKELIKSAGTDSEKSAFSSLRLHRAVEQDLKAFLPSDRVLVLREFSRLVLTNQAKGRTIAELAGRRRPVSELRVKIAAGDVRIVFGQSSSGQTTILFAYQGDSLTKRQQIIVIDRFAAMLGSSSQF